MQAFVLNRHGRMVFPSNIMPELDFSTLESLDQLDRVIRRDFEMKAPTGTDILQRLEKGGYDSRYALMRDLALNLFWANRFAMTMYDKRPTRWGDLSRTRRDVYLPVLTAWEDADTKVPILRSQIHHKRDGTCGPGLVREAPDQGRARTDLGEIDRKFEDAPALDVDAIHLAPVP